MEDQEIKDRENAERENAERTEGQKPERRPTVVVTCGLQNGVQIRRHRPGLEDRAPLMPSGQGYELKNGDTGGIDKEWFMGWLDENPGLSLVTSGMITWRDEEQRDEAEHDGPRIISNDDHSSDPDEDPINAGTGVQDGAANPERTNPPAQPQAATERPDAGKAEGAQQGA